jgi:hypothetical protein
MSYLVGKGWFRSRRRQCANFPTWQWLRWRCTFRVPKSKEPHTSSCRGRLSIIAARLQYLDDKLILPSIVFGRSCFGKLALASSDPAVCCFGFGKVALSSSDPAVVVAIADLAILVKALHDIRCTPVVSVISPCSTRSHSSLMQVQANKRDRTPPDITLQHVHCTLSQEERARTRLSRSCLELGTHSGSHRPSIRGRLTLSALCNRLLQAGVIACEDARQRIARKIVRDYCREDKCEVESKVQTSIASLLISRRSSPVKPTARAANDARLTLTESSFPLRCCLRIDSCGGGGSSVGGAACETAVDQHARWMG